MIWLLLVASIAQAQEVSTPTASISIESQMKSANMGKAIRDLESGRYRQTGKPTFANGFCFGDATCQTTAPAGGGAGLSSTQTFSGSNTFTGQTTFSGSVSNSSSTYMTSGGFSSASGPNQSNPLNTGTGVWALSIDGTTQSSGCVVAVKFPDGGLATDQITFTSTTTGSLAITAAMAGVLLESCAPGSVCKVGFGPNQSYRVQADATGIADNDPGWTFSSTRCRVIGQGVENTVLQGYKLQDGAVAGNAFVWIRMR